MDGLAGHFNVILTYVHVGKEHKQNGSSWNTQIPFVLFVQVRGSQQKNYCLLVVLCVTLGC